MSTRIFGSNAIGDDLYRNDITDITFLTAYKEVVLPSTFSFLNFRESIEKLNMIHQKYPELLSGLSR